MLNGKLFLRHSSLKFQWVLTILFVLVGAAPRLAEFGTEKPLQQTPPSNRLSYTINQANQDSGPNFFQALQKSGVLQNVMSMFGGGGRNQQRRFASDQPEKPSDASILNTGEVASSIDSVPTNYAANAAVDDWKKTLLGPSGVLTEIFNLINEKRKEDLEKILKNKANPIENAPLTIQPSLPLAPDFTKIFESFLAKTPTGDFAEPVPDLGICDRVSCGEIYSAMDEFRKSELFSNFQANMGTNQILDFYRLFDAAQQAESSIFSSRSHGLKSTAISLIHDPKGWDIIGELLANPELIESYVANGAEKNSNAKPHKTLGMNSKNFGEIKSGDGNLGVDFSHLVDQTPTKIDKGASVGGGNGGSPDYYSAIDDKEEEISIPDIKTSSVDVVKNGPVEYNTPIPPIYPNKSGTPSLNNKFKTVDLTMPEIAESIDELPEDIDAFSVNKPDEQIGNFNNKNTDSKLAPKVQNRFFSVVETTTGVYTTKRFSSGTTKIINTIARKILTTTTKRPITTTKAPTRPTPRPTTRKNFRKDNDYYAMYYDQN